MERFEDELRQSVERRSPPPEFTARVMTEVRLAARRRPFFRRPVAFAAIAAALILTFSLSYRAETQRRRAEAARDQLIFSLQITGSKIGKAREVVLKTYKENSQ